MHWCQVDDGGSGKGPPIGQEIDKDLSPNNGREKRNDSGQIHLKLSRRSAVTNSTWKWVSVQSQGLSLGCSYMWLNNFVMNQDRQPRRKEERCTRRDVLGNLQNRHKIGKELEIGI